MMGKGRVNYHPGSIIFLIFAILVHVVSPLPPQKAYGISEKKRLQNEKSRLLELKKKSEKAKRELESAIRKQEKLKKDVGDLKSQLRKKERFLKRVDRELRYIETLNSRYDRKMSALEERKEILIKAMGSTIQSVYVENTDSLDPVSSLVADEKKRYITTLLISRLNREISGVTGEERRLGAKVENLEGSRKYWERKHTSTEGQKKSIEKKRKRREKELTRVAVERKQIERKHKKLEKDIASLQKTVSAIEKSIRVKRKDTKFSKSVPTGFTFPVRGTVVTRFGRIKDKDFNVYIENKGIEIKGRPGGGVRAVNDGVVVYQGNLSGFGLVTVIEHRGDIFTVYGKAALYNVKVGDKVKKGQKIGMLSKEGPPVVYFELRVGGKPVNPLKYIKIPRA